MRIKVAATQMNIILGDVKSNLEKAVKLIDKAASQGADVIVLPEFFTSGIAINPIMDLVPERNKKHMIIETIKKKANDLNTIICGSILQTIGKDTYNSMVLIKPYEKHIHIHNKDIPTQFENKYYINGDKKRNCGIYGMALCWEMLRTKTIKELKKQTKIALAGSCWWGIPDGSENAELKMYNENLSKETPRIFATIAGIPVVHSSLKGKIFGDRNLRCNDQVTRPLIGKCQIIDATGNTIASILDNDEDAVLVEELELREREVHDPGRNFWMVNLRAEYINAWQKENTLGRQLYQERRKSKST